ncbi:MAG: molybdopterin-dependent oxidoreductase [Terriglobia bacterium]
MRRREFIWTLGASFGAARAALADYSVVSEKPLIAQFNLESVDSRYTPAAEFYVRNHFAVPVASSVSSIQITGEVKGSAVVTETDVARLKLRQLGAVLECSGDGTSPYALAGNALWQGWSLRDVVELAAPKPGAAYLHLYGADGFVRSVPIQRLEENAMLATRLNQAPLLPNHGAPWRAFFPGYYGMDSVKWLSRIEVARDPIPPVPDEYWAMVQGKSGKVERRPLPAIQLKSAFIYPDVGAVLRAGILNARGLAWSGGAPIMAVEVSVDGGESWRLAEIEPAGKYEWRFWRASLDLTQTGVAQLACKALDQAGHEQPATRPPNRLDDYADNTIERIRVIVI